MGEENLEQGTKLVREAMKGVYCPILIIKEGLGVFIDGRAFLKDIPGAERVHCLNELLVWLQTQKYTVDDVTDKWGYPGMSQVYHVYPPPKN